MCIIGLHHYKDAIKELIEAQAKMETILYTIKEQ